VSEVPSGHSSPLPSVLVGMLHVGEPSLPRVREYLRAQVDVDVEVLEVAHLPEREAHERLYAAFDAADARFDALVKVDADMELVEPRLLHAIAILFRGHQELDHLLLGVDDWFSGRHIQGLTAWRRGVRWTSPPPELFTDLPTNSVRTKLKIMDAGRPLVLHASDPTDEQAARYGLHRGLKAVATGKASRIGRLTEFVDHAESDPARGRRIAVAAIDLALEHEEIARRLLDSAGSDESGLRALVSRSEDVGLFSRTRARIESLMPIAAAGNPLALDAEQAASDAGGRPRSLTGNVREHMGRLLRGRVVSEIGTIDDAALRAEFIALLDSRD
jgi:hypothetical protein